MKTITALILAAGASAHTIFLQLGLDGTTYPISYAIADPSYDGPITDVTSEYMACNGGPNPTTPSNETITVAAGTEVTAVWRHTLQSGSDDVVDASHKGPMMAYMKKVANAVTDAPSNISEGGGWFKIQEAGYSDGVWATTTLIADLGQQYITIPSCIEPGQYLLRAELLALHAASSEGGAQFYMECAQLVVTGGGSTSPTTYSIPGIYSATDPGILIDIYEMTNSSTYTIPGPAVFTC